MNEETGRYLRKQTVQAVEERVDCVTQIVRSAEGRAAEVVAREIVHVLEGDAVIGFTFTRPNKTLIVNGVRESPDSVRLSGGEGNPVPVLLLRLAPHRAFTATKRVQRRGE